MNIKILNAKEYELIKQLKLFVKKKVSGRVSGEQRSPIQGDGIEFADYREYIPGDDIRKVDWSVFLRFRKLLIKLCAEEKELRLLLILDNSRSMNFGEPDKFLYAKKICCILAGIALENGNRTGLLTLSKMNEDINKPEINQITLKGFIDLISKVQTVDDASPVSSIKKFSSKYGRKCMVVLVSDLLFPEWDKIINALGISGSESYIIHVLSSSEFEPFQFGETTLVDSENNNEIPMHIDLNAINKYNKILNDFLHDVRLNCHKKNIGYSIVSSDVSILRLFRHDLRKGGLFC